MADTIIPVKTKSLRVTLLEQVEVYGQEDKTHENRLNLYRITCDSSTKRDELESALKNLK
jgi:hypothetical protein